MCSKSILTDTILCFPVLTQYNASTKVQDMTSPKINYEPRGDRILVKPLPPPGPKEGEIFVPASQQRPLNEGLVVAVGPGMRNRITGQIDPIDLEPGDHIGYVDFSGFDVVVDGESFLSMRDEEIHGRRPR